MIGINGVRMVDVEVVELFVFELRLPAAEVTLFGMVVISVTVRPAG